MLRSPARFFNALKRTKLAVASAVLSATGRPIAELDFALGKFDIVQARIRKALYTICGIVLAGCGEGNGSPAPPTKTVTLNASPTSYALTLFDSAPQPVTITRSYGSFTSLGLSVSDPTSLGVTVPVLSGSTARFGIIPIANTALGKTVTATDSTGATTSVSVTSGVCGRPAGLVAAQQVIPSSGATGVNASIGQLFFVAYFSGFNPVPSGNLHLIVGAQNTLEGGSLVPATVPPGTALPTPIPLPNATSIIVSATLPALTAGQKYQTELYNDPCQFPVLAGTFST